MNLTEKYTQKLKRYPNKYFNSHQEKLTAKKVQELLKANLQEVSQAQSFEEWEQAIQAWNETKSHIDTHFELIQLAFQCYTEDEAIEKEERRLREVT